jgi:hypothetical protein
MQITIPRPTHGTAIISVTCTDTGTADAAAAKVTTTFKIAVTHVDLPAEVTINQASTQADPTNATTVFYDVVFDQPVTGFTGNGVDLSSSTASGFLFATVSSGVPNDGAHYTVAVSGMTGDGTVVANVKPGAAVNPSNQGNNSSTSTDNTITVDYTPPDVTINQNAGQADPTNGSIKYFVQFSEPIASFPNSAVAFGGTAGAFASVQSITAGGPANSYIVTVTVAGSHTGTVTATIPQGAVTDLAGNGNNLSTSTDNTVTFDNQPPTVTVTKDPSQGNPGGGLKVTFDVAFSEPVVGFDGTKVNLTNSTTGGSLVATVTDTGDQTHFTVAVTGMAASGNVVAQINAGVVKDPAGNSNLGPVSSTVAFVDSGELQFSQPSSSIDEMGNSQVTVTVTRTGGSTGALSVDYTTANGTAVAGTDYTTTSGTLNWAGGDATPQTITIPLLNDATFEADKAFTVGLSNISLAGALGPQSTTTVNINEEGGLSFSAANYNTAEGGSVTITVHRLFDSVGAVSVNYATSDGTATAGSDYTTTTGTLNWADGDSADKTFNVPVAADGVSEGTESFNLTLSSPTGNGLAGPQSTATVTIAKSNGITIDGTSKVTKSTFTDADGDQVTISLGGKVGTLTYYLTNGKGPISEIDLAGTDPTKSTVSFSVKKAKTGSDGRFGIGEVDGTGLKSFTAKTGDVTGAGFNLTGFIGSLTVGNISNGADLELLGPIPTTKSATAITAGVIADGTDINVAAPLKGLTAIAIGNGTVEAPSVGNVNIKGQRASKVLPFISGDFNSDLTVSGAGIDPVTGKALKSLKVAGSVNNATISVGGNVGSVSVGSFLGSELFAGYTGPVDGSGTFNSGSTITTFQVKGTTNAFAHSFVIASNFKNVTLASVDPNNGGTKFGFLYHTSMAALSVKNPAFKFDPKGAAEQDLAPDFYVKKV